MLQIQKIYQKNLEIEQIKNISKYVNIEEIIENDYNLSVSTYVEKLDSREKVDIDSLNKEINENVDAINKLRDSINKIISGLKMNSILKMIKEESEVG